MSRRIVVAEALPEMRRAVGRDVAVTYVTERRLHRSRPVATSVDESPRLFSHVLTFPETDGRGRRPIDLLSEPASVVCRPRRLYLPSSLAERLIVLDIVVGVVSCFAGPSGVPGEVFSASSHTLALPVLMPGQRVRLRVANASRDKRRRLRILAAMVTELSPPAPIVQVPTSWFPGSSLPPPFGAPFGSIDGGSVPIGAFDGGSVPFSSLVGDPPLAHAPSLVGPSRYPDHEIERVEGLSADGPWYPGCRVRVHSTGADYVLARWLPEDGAPDGVSSIASPLEGCVWERVSS